METATAQSLVHVPAGGGEQYHIIGELVTFKATHAQTDGRFVLAEMIARSGGPPLHTHRSSETFTILEGEIDFSTIEDGVVKTIHATAGETVIIPGGVMHTYSVTGAAPCRCIAVLAPGDDMEGFFREAGTALAPGEPEPNDPPDIPAMLAVAERYGLTFLPPAEG